ncbi:hypothetical protein AVEN_238103-1 [Araneus ventricosus]|nr:hypothetical protein AVEN_238103-1 [Araneus ventricosus]
MLNWVYSCTPSWSFQRTPTGSASICFEPFAYPQRSFAYPKLVASRTSADPSVCSSWSFTYPGKSFACPTGLRVPQLVHAFNWIFAPQLVLVCSSWSSRIAPAVASRSWLDYVPRQLVITRAPAGPSRTSLILHWYSNWSFAYPGGPSRNNWSCAYRRSFAFNWSLRTSTAVLPCGTQLVLRVLAGPSHASLVFSTGPSRNRVVLHAPAGHRAPQLVLRAPQRRSCTPTRSFAYMVHELLVASYRLGTMFFKDTFH